MHILVGTEIGLTKVLPFYPEGKGATIKPSVLLPIEPKAKESHEAYAKEINDQIQTFGTIDKSKEISFIQSVTLCSAQLVLLCRKNGSIDIWDHSLIQKDSSAEPCRVTFQPFDGLQSNKLNSLKSEDKAQREIVGIEALNS
jgi:hypothetical protein